MVCNALFPHLLSTIILRRYAPGTLTGILLIVPMGVYILIRRIGTTDELIHTILSFICVTIIVLTAIPFLFKIGGKISDGSPGSAD